jgi:protein-tyrosine phosphatase
MVDIHCHILPGLDDGPDALEMSLEMAEAAIADGITHLVATPHANDSFPFEPERIRKLCEELRERLGDRLQLTTGCDFHMSFENLQAVQTDPARFTINQKNYLLVEFADFAIPASMDAALRELRMKGLWPIITHPERNPILAQNRKRVNAWVQEGCLVQVTAGSLLGRFGQRAQKASEAWLDEGAIHFIASDAHNTTSRPLQLRPAFDVVAKRKGEAVARALFRENPLATIEGNALPHLPELQSEDKAEPPRRKRFLFF